MRILKFFLKRMLLFSLPLFLLLGGYLILDPFKVLYSYDNYYVNTCISKNRDYISSETFIRNVRKYHYDSFIFGASTSLFIPPSLWGNYISTSNYIFSFDASSENIIGIWSKIKYLHEHNIQLKNVLLVFDTGVTFDRFNNQGHVFMKDYNVYKSSKFNFHYESLLSFLNFNFLVSLFHYKISGEFHQYMNGVLDNSQMNFDLITNELIYSSAIEELKTDSLKYYEDHKKLFTERSGLPTSMYSQINSDYIIKLQEINEIFINDNTNFRIIIAPLYNQISFNESDLATLKSIFGEDFVFDFSGINEYTEKVSNYYDNTHFKHYIGLELLTKAYK